jgi:hypothetical protein
MVLLNQQIQLSNELNIFDQFSQTLNLNWLGVKCFFVVKFVSILLVFGYVFYNVDVEYLSN